MDENPYKAPGTEKKMVAQFKVFKSYRESWDAMAQQVADFLTTIGPDKVIAVSHSHESTMGTIIVWYWEQPSSSESL